MPYLLDGAPSAGDGTCTYRRLGFNIDVPGHDLKINPGPQTGEACAKACCNAPRCAGAIFERFSALTFGGCTRGQPCCFMKSSVAYPQPMENPPPKGATLWVIPGRRSMRDDKETPPEDIKPTMRASNEVLGQDASQDESRITAFLARYRCQHVYLDVGSNVGIQIRKLFQPHLYPEAKVRPHFDAAFGSSPRCRVCAIGFEPNPRHGERLDMLERKMESAGFGAMVVRAAAGASDGLLRLQFSVRRSNYDDAGASAFGIGRYTGRSSVVVRQVHIARIMQHVRRQLPPSGNILMKLDVEGSEWMILPDLMVTRAICAVNRIFIEYHTSDFKRLEQERWADPVQAASYQAMRMSLRSTRAALERAVEEHATRNFTTSSCNVQLVDMDDETHTLDRGSKSWPHGRQCSARM